MPLVPISTGAHAAIFAASLVATVPDLYMFGSVGVEGVACG